MHLTTTTLAAIFFAVPFFAQPTAAQEQELTSEEHIEIGDSLWASMDPEGALEHYRAAFDRTNYDMLWKFARAQIDVAKQLEGNEYQDLRDSLYGVARLYAEEAVKIDSTKAVGYYQLAQALGRLSRTKGGRDRVRFARQIYEYAARALELDPSHDGAHHIIGAWHAEIRRLSGLTRMFARTFMGAGFMGRASWDSAVVHLERSVELDPETIFHHLELAEIYIDVDRPADARRELRTVLELPEWDVMDHRHKDRARELLSELNQR